VCDHPYESLSIVSSGSVRGQAKTVHVSCALCGRKVAGIAGTALFVVGMRDELARLRVEIKKIGGDVTDPSMGASRRPEGKRRPRDAKATCPHYLAWLDIDGDGRPGGRGRATLTTVKCRNCGTSWGDHTGLLMAMKKELSALWLEVRRLGGVRPQ